MKVIKEMIWELPFTCKNCKSELVAEAADVSYTNYEDDNDFYVECPGCGTRHIIKNGHDVLPPKVINSAYTKRRS